jgi:hypothetical protein
MKLLFNSLLLMCVIRNGATAVQSSSVDEEAASLCQAGPYDCTVCHKRFATAHGLEVSSDLCSILFLTTACRRTACVRGRLFSIKTRNERPILNIGLICGVIATDFAYVYIGLYDVPRRRIDGIAVPVYPV